MSLFTERPSILAVIDENRMPYVSSAISDARVIELTADSALITYRANVEAVRDGRPLLGVA